MSDPSPPELTHPPVGSWAYPPPPQAVRPPDEPTARTRGTRRGAVAGVAGIALLCGALGGAVGRLGATASTPGPAPQARGGPSTAFADGAKLTVGDVVTRLEPSVVAVDVAVRQPGGATGRGAGTGVILTAGGQVMTNAHVVSGATSVHVTLNGEAKARPATIVGSDTTSDLALLQIDGASGLPPAPLGSSSSVRVGDEAVAIGNALALEGGPTVTKGIISALDRSLAEDAGTMSGLLQTDASISSGNSGGPLVNAAGQVIGINTAVAAGNRSNSAENIGFAIAIDTAKPVIERLRSHAPSAAAPFLGVSAAEPADGSRGASVASVASSSPAAAAGLQPGDLITAVDGKALGGPNDFVGAISARAAGDRLSLDYLRGGVGRSTQVTLAPRAS